MAMNPDNQFPARGDTLFRHDLPDMHNNACINCHRMDLSKWYAYVDGYKHAADALAGRVLQDRLMIDALIYPLAYLYRHHVEIVLKTIIFIGSTYADETPPNYAHHQLENLWKCARRYIHMFWSTADTEPLDAAGELVSEFDQVDHGSFAFRYPVSKNGADALPKVTRINVRHFAEMASRLGYFLTCCMTGMDVELDAKQEYLADELSQIDSEY